MNLNTIYNPNRNNSFFRGIVRCLAHLVGIWEPVDYIRVGRKASIKRPSQILYQIKQRRIGCILDIEIPNFTNIGTNFQLPHGRNVVINQDVIIGNNCVIYKGVTLGRVRSGKRAGCPRLEDNVCVCTNAVVVGGVIIGHDSLIAANSFVDFDVPPHSIVIGNPGVIKHKEYASQDYIDG